MPLKQDSVMRDIAYLGWKQYLALIERGMIYVFLLTKLSNPNKEIRKCQQQKEQRQKWMITNAR